MMLVVSMDVRSYIFGLLHVTYLCSVYAEQDTKPELIKMKHIKCRKHPYSCKTKYTSIGGGKGARGEALLTLRVLHRI